MFKFKSLLNLLNLLFFFAIGTYIIGWPSQRTIALRGEGPRGLVYLLDERVPSYSCICLSVRRWVRA